MKKFWTFKKIVFLLSVLIIVGLFILFLFFKDKIADSGIVDQNGSNGKLKEDEFEPASQIMSPANNSWHNKDFIINVLDEDLDSGLELNSCKYQVFTFDTERNEHYPGQFTRKCSFGVAISIGGGNLCRFEGKKACWLYVSSQDKAGNMHLPAKEKGSIKYYNIDWTGPNIGKVFIDENSSENQQYPLQIQEGSEYDFKVKVTDNLIIGGCYLYVDNRSQGVMSSLTPGCRKDCVYSKRITFSDVGSYKVFVACADAAGNTGRGDTIEAKTNLPPKITSCQVSPANGTIKTEFQFLVEVSDPDEDELFFNWSFGDNETSNIQNSSHYYKKADTYQPKIIVSDGLGGQDECSTAWAVISEE